MAKVSHRQGQLSRGNLPVDGVEGAALQMNAHVRRMQVKPNTLAGKRRHHVDARAIQPTPEFFFILRQRSIVRLNLPPYHLRPHKPLFRWAQSDAGESHARNKKTFTRNDRDDIRIRAFAVRIQPVRSGMTFHDEIANQIRLPLAAVTD